jgi:hypothetical protein
MEEPKIPPQPTNPGAAPSKIPEWVLWLILFLLLIGIGLGIFFYFRSQNESTGTDTDNAQANGDEADSGQGAGDDEDEADTDTGVIVYSEFAGTGVGAEIPEGWTINEYFNGDGSNMLVEGVTYTGLTGLEVVNPDSEVVFNLIALNGIGGTNECPEYYHFADTDAAYQAAIIAQSTTEGTVPAVVNLVGTDYSELTLFDVNSRRIVTALYRDMTVGDATFDAACGIEADAWTIEEISFTSDGSTNHTYDPTITPGTPDEELEILDVILDSLVAI